MGINVVPLLDYHLYKKQLAKSCHSMIKKHCPGEVYLICKIEGKELLGLCDLGVYISIMPLDVAQGMHTGHMRPSHVGLAMLDGSHSNIVGMLTSVLVCVGNYRFVCDFLVPNMQQRNIVEHH